MQVTEFLSVLQDSDSFEPSIRALRNESHLVDNQLTSCKQYMFNDRLSGGVFFSDEHYDEYKQILTKSRNFAMSQYSRDRETMIHGDLQNPQNVICDKSGLKGVVDWEISGFFDGLYDLASVESEFIDRPANYWNGMDELLVRESFRNEFSVTEIEGKIIDAYKIWNHYLKLEWHNSNDFEPPDDRTQKSEIDFARNKLEELGETVGQI